MIPTMGIAGTQTRQLILAKDSVGITVQQSNCLLGELIDSDDGHRWYQKTMGIANDACVRERVASPWGSVDRC